MEKSGIEQKLKIESELVREESMRVLKEFEAIENWDFDSCPSDEVKTEDE